MTWRLYQVRLRDVMFGCVVMLYKNTILSKFNALE